MNSIDFASRRRFTELNQLKASAHLGGYVCEFLNWGFLGERWWRNYLHVHSFFEICCAFDGEGVFRIKGQECTVRAGDVFVARPSEPHEIVSSEAEPLGIYFWAFTLNRRELTSAEPDVDRLLIDFAHGSRWVSPETAAMQHTLLALTDEVVQRAPGYRRTIDGLVAKLILDTARAVVPPRPAAQLDAPLGDERARLSHEQRLIQQITRYLRDNYSRPITIRDVAAQVHLSERHVSRIFHAATGTTIKEFVQGLRIESAARQLIDTRQPIQSIGEAAGFPDVQHFTTTFRRHTGLTPAVFRKQRGTRFVDPTQPGHVQP